LDGSWNHSASPPPHTPLARRNSQGPRKTGKSAAQRRCGGKGGLKSASLKSNLNIGLKDSPPRSIKTSKGGGARRWEKREVGEGASAMVAVVFRTPAKIRRRRGV